MRLDSGLYRYADAEAEESRIVRGKQAELLFRGFVPAAFGTLIISALLAASLWKLLAPGILLGWLTASWAILLLRGLLARRFFRQAPPPDKVSAWINLFAVGAAASGAMWGCSAWLFMPPWLNGAAAMPVIFFIAGATAAGSVVLAAAERVAVLFLLPALLPLSAQLFGSDVPANAYMGTGVLVYLAVLLLMSRRGQAVIRNTWRTDLENDRLKTAVIMEKRLAEERMSRYFDNAPGYFYTLVRHPDGRLAMPFASVGIRDLYGLEPEDVAESAKPLTDLTHPDDIERMVLEMEISARKLSSFHGEHRIRHPGKGERWIETRSRPQRQPDGGTLWYGFMHDITERKQVLEALQNSRLSLEEAQRIAHIGSWEVDMVNNVLTWSDEIFRIWEIDKARFEATFEAFLETVHPEDRKKVSQAYHHSVANRTGYRIEHRLLLADGRVKYIAERGEPFYDADGKPLRFVGTSLDITERKRIEEEVYRQASYDSLTGLPNRRLFGNRLREEIAKAERRGAKLALLFIDLDRFKEVNDSLGHEAGDGLLAAAAQRIRDCVRLADIVARLGGDEFVAILPDAEETVSLGRVAQCIVDSLRQPYRCGKHSVYVSASIGVAVYPRDADNAETLIACADQAMYAAKEAGRNSFSFFTSGMLEQAQQRLRLVNDLRDALGKGQLEVHYQPIIEVAGGKAVKAEALLRWRHPQLGMVRPDRFIPIAEETGLIQEIGAWVFREAVDTAKRWNVETGLGDSRQISVNMSPRQFTRGHGDQIAIDYLRAYGLDPALIGVEITEGLLLDDCPAVTEKLEKLRAAGIQISLDDFGTGYSAMAYLKKFHIDYIKIDQSFVRDLETDPGDRAIAEAIVAMAHRLGLKVIAEGVETQGQRDLLAAVGCEYLQGYLYAKPMPAEAFLAYVNGGCAERLITATQC